MSKNRVSSSDSGENLLLWRKTPLIKSLALSRMSGCQIYLKLDNLQPSGSFKSRGIGNAMYHGMLDAFALGKTPHFYCSSGGNAGLGCAHAGTTLKWPTTIVVPVTTSAFMIQKLRDAGARQVLQEGASWMESDDYLRSVLLPEAQARGEHPVYIHPFDAPDIWTGHASLIHEVIQQLRQVEDDKREGDHQGIHDVKHESEIDIIDPAAIVCSVGGGGLFCGIMQGLDENDLSHIPVVACETAGADSLYQSLKQGSPVTLPDITSIAKSLGAKRIADKAFEYAQRKNVKAVVYSDQEAVSGCKLLADEERILVEPACGVCFAPLREGRLKALLPSMQPNSKIVIVVCGGSGLSLDILNGWIKDHGI